MSATVSGSSNYRTEYRLLLTRQVRRAASVFFCVTRLLLGDNGAQQYALDIDGDGRMLATVDGLIATRLMLGIRGQAIIAGITFPAGATCRRRPAIQRYLSTSAARC